MSRYQSAEKCPCGARANAALRGTGVCSACNVRLGRERFHRMPGHVSESGRVFGAEFVAEPKRAIATGPGTCRIVLVDPEQLLLDLKQCSGKTRSRTVNPARALVALEKRGADALEELDAPTPKRPRTAELFYRSEGGEVLRTTLHGLTGTEAEYIERVSVFRPGMDPSKYREVTWPSQIYADERARARTAALRAEMDAGQSDLAESADLTETTTREIAQVSGK